MDKYYKKLLSGHPSEIEKNSLRNRNKETENQGSAVPLHMKGYPLKLDELMS